jgi:hypothetical protein
MIHLPATVGAWDTPDFVALLKRELAAQAAALPLQRAVATSSVALDDSIEIMLLAAEATPDRIIARVGVFFAGVVAGCGCADDPTPLESQPEYCELSLMIDRTSTAADVALASD